MRECGEIWLKWAPYNKPAADKQDKGTFSIAPPSLFDFMQLYPSIPKLCKLTEEDLITMAQAAARGPRAHAPAPVQASALGPSQQGLSVEEV